MEKQLAADRVILKPDASVVVTGAGHRAGIGATLSNPTSETLDVQLSLESPEGKTLAARTVRLAPGKSEHAVLAAPAGTGLILDRYELAIHYEGRYESRSDRTTVFVRRLAEKPGVSTAKLYGYGSEVYVLADDALEVTVDPSGAGASLKSTTAAPGATRSPSRMTGWADCTTSPLPTASGTRSKRRTASASGATRRIRRKCCRTALYFPTALRASSP